MRPEGPEGEVPRSIQARAVIPGSATGVALVSDEPLSFWGGYDPKSGRILDRRHPLWGEMAAGRVLVIPFTSGSSTTTQILLESIRAGSAPAALVSRGEDAFLALASIVADEMYGTPVPILAVSVKDFSRFRTGQHIAIDASGRIEITDEGDAG